MKVLKRIGLVAGAGLLVFSIVAYMVGTREMAPCPFAINPAPDTLHAENVTIPSASGSTLSGWFVQGQPGKGAVVLMHGLRASRLAMLDRARFLSSAGYSILLFDFQAHGQSPGRHITFGYLESKDAASAVAWLRARAPGERIGVIGVSLGGAAALLADPPLAVDAMVIEASYPTIEQALDDRIAMRLGWWATVLAPALTLQLRPRLGFGVEDLHPIDHVQNITIPKLFLAGSNDRHTRIEESLAMFDRAAEPKELWIVEGAEHVDLHEYAQVDYEARIGAFLATHLRGHTESGCVRSAPDEREREVAFERRRGRQMNPEHGERFEQPRNLQSARVDRVETNLVGERPDRIAGRRVVAAHEHHRSRLAVDWRAHVREPGLVETLYNRGATRPFGDLFAARRVKAHR